MSVTRGRRALQITGRSLTLTSVFAAVYLGMALGRWPGLMLDRTGIALRAAVGL